MTSKEHIGMMTINERIRNYEELTDIKFALISASLSVAGAMTIAGILYIIKVTFNLDWSTALFEDVGTGIKLFTNALLMIIVGPFIETVICQLIPVWLLRKFTKRKLPLILITAFLFTLFHSFRQFYSLMILPLSLFLAWAFVSRYQHSLKRAILLTTGIHGLQNMVGFTLSMIFY